MIVATIRVATVANPPFALIDVAEAELASPSEIILVEEPTRGAVPGTVGFDRDVLSAVDFSSSVVALVQVGVSSGLLFCHHIDLVDVSPAAGRPDELIVRLRRSPWARACNDDLRSRLAVVEIDRSLLNSVRLLTAYQDDRLIAVAPAHG